MSDYLCTFPGKYGDILWSLATAKYISEKVIHKKVDFAVMTYYHSLAELIAAQPYINAFRCLTKWVRVHSDFGDQPWQPDKDVQKDLEGRYKWIWHLGYRCHPGRIAGGAELPLVHFIAHQQGLAFKDWSYLPFLRPDPFQFIAHSSQMAKDIVVKDEPYVALCFNDQYKQRKQNFTEVFLKNLEGSGIEVVQLDKFSWLDSAFLLEHALCYVGDRSANWVIANGVGCECITFEPHPAKHKSGRLGYVFSCPEGKELALPFPMPENVGAEAAASLVKQKAEKKLRSVGIGA